MLEREVKLGAGPAFHLPDLNGVVDGVTITPPEAVRLETVYYDTSDLRLARWGVSLRHRRGEGWTLKLPPIHASTEGQAGAPLLERDELTFQGGAAKPPAAAVAIVRAYVRTAELVPVARLSTVRRRVRLLDASGARLAEVVDDEVSVRDGRSINTAATPAMTSARTATAKAMGMLCCTTGPAMAEPRGMPMSHGDATGLTVVQHIAEAGDACIAAPVRATTVAAATRGNPGTAKRPRYVARMLGGSTPSRCQIGEEGCRGMRGVSSPRVRGVPHHRRSAAHPRQFRRC